MPLPIEVFEAVIDQASDDGASLCDLSLTCTAFLPRSRYHLFGKIHIWTVKKMESSRDFLDAHPWLLPLVHKVALSFDIPSYYDKRNIRVLDIVPVHLLTRLPSLRAWTMGPHIFQFGLSLSLHRSVTSLYSRHSSCIQNLDLSGLQFYRFSDFTGLVSAFTSIHTLTCGNIMITFWREEEPKPWYVESTSMLSRLLNVSTLKVSF